MKSTIILIIAAIALGVGGDAWAAYPSGQSAPATASISRFNWNHHLHKRYYPSAQSHDQIYHTTDCIWARDPTAITTAMMPYATEGSFRT